MGWAEIDMRYCVEPHASKNRYAIITFKHVLRAKSSCFACMDHVSHLRWNKYHPTCDGNGEIVQFSAVSPSPPVPSSLSSLSRSDVSILACFSSIESSIRSVLQVCRLFQRRLYTRKELQLLTQFAIEQHCSVLILTQSSSGVGGGLCGISEIPVGNENP